VTVATEPLLRLEGVHKAFGDLPVLRGIDLTVDDQDVVALIGPSGCGKSTLLRCINLLENLDAGRVVLGGDEISRVGADANAVRRRIGIVFQAYNLFPHMSVIDNITLSPVKVLKQSKDVAQEHAHELLERFGLSAKADAYPDQLSGGQQQRAAIVRALAMDPELLLLDEITSALDPELVGEVLDILRDLKASGLTMVMATHEISFARDVATRVVFLDGGVVHEQGPPEEILDHPQRGRTQRFLQRVDASGRL
jgi:polar amino acid transport system ATP-binding protein